MSEIIHPSENYKDITVDFFRAASGLTGSNYMMEASLSLSDTLRVPEFDNPLLDSIACLTPDCTPLSLAELLAVLVPEEAVYGVCCDFFCCTESMVPICMSYHGIVSQSISLLRHYIKSAASQQESEPHGLLIYIRTVLPSLTNSQLYLLFSVYAILLSLAILGQTHRNAFTISNCRHNDDYNLDILHYALYISVPDMQMAFYDEYSATFPYGIFVEVLNIESPAPDYYCSCLLLLIQVATVGITNKLPPKHGTQLLDDLVSLVQQVRPSYDWLHKIDYEAYLTNYYNNAKYHSRIYAVYTIARLDSRTLPEKCKPLMEQFSPSGIYKYMDSATRYFISMLNSQGKNGDFFKDAYLLVYQLGIRRRPYTIVEKLSSFYGVVQSTVTLQAIEYIRRVTRLLSKNLSKTVNNVVLMVSDTLSKLAITASMANIVNLDRIYRKFCYSHFLVWFSELESIQEAFTIDGKTTGAYEDMQSLLACWFLEFGLLPYYQLFEESGYFHSTEVTFYYYIIYFLLMRIIYFYSSILRIDITKTAERIVRFEDEDYLLEETEEQLLPLELSCIRYCRLCSYYHDRWLNTYPSVSAYYEGEGGLPADDVFQLQNRYKVLTFTSKYVHWIFGTASRDHQFIPGLLADMISSYRAQESCHITRKELPLPELKVKLPSKEALVRAFCDTKSKLASMHLPRNLYYRQVLREDIMRY